MIPFGVPRFTLAAAVVAVAMIAVSGARIARGEQGVPAAASAAIPAAGATIQELPPIRNFLQVTPDFCTGGQPRVEHFVKLKTDGVRAVLNLRTPGEHRAEEEEAAVRQAGLRYYNIPVVYSAPADAQVDDFLRLTDDPANRPMFIHCTAAIRVGAFWMIRRVLRDGMTAEAAHEEARKVGLVNAPHLDEFANAYIAAHRKGPPVR